MEAMGQPDVLTNEMISLDDVSKTVIKVAAATVIATTLVSALSEPPRVELMSLPEPVPIIQLYQAYDDDVVPDEDEESDEKTSRWQKLLKALKYLLVALALAASVLFGALKGCAGIVAGTLLPSHEQQEQTAHQSSQSNEDERGVAQGS